MEEKGKLARREVAYQLCLTEAAVFPSLDTPCKREHCDGRKLKKRMKWMKNSQFSEVDGSVQGKVEMKINSVRILGF